MREQESRVIAAFQILELSLRDTLDEQFSLWRGAELLRPSYMFAIQVSPVTGVTKNTNAIPIFLFVCYFDWHENRRRPDGGLLRRVERRAGVYARLSRW